MTPGAIARRYGRALFELAVETNSVAEIGAGLSELAAAVSSLDHSALAAGVLSAGQREALQKALVEKLGAQTPLGCFVGVLVSNDRLDQLPAIRDSFEKLEDASAGRVRALVRSAAPLADSERAAPTSPRTRARSAPSSCLA